MVKIIKSYGKTVLIFLLVICLVCFLFGLFQLIGFLSFKTTSLLFMIFMVMLFLILGFRYGKKANKKGYLAGVKIGLCLILVLVFINFVFYKTNFSLERIVYYLVLILSSILGAMIGINKKS